MAIKVVVSNKNFNGFRGVKFVNGVGIFEDEALGRRIADSLGYEIIEDEKPKDEPKTKVEEKNVEDEPKRGGRRSNK